MSYSYVGCAISPIAYAEIKAVLMEAGYDHRIDEHALDMDGLSLTPDPEKAEVEEEQERMDATMETLDRAEIRTLLHQIGEITHKCEQLRLAILALSKKG